MLRPLHSRVAAAPAASFLSLTAPHRLLAPLVLCVSSASARLAESRSWGRQERVPVCCGKGLLLPQGCSRSVLGTAGARQRSVPAAAGGDGNDVPEQVCARFPLIPGTG